MRARAPGKLVVTGAYAVLYGAPAVVCAVDRHAYARPGEGARTAEVEAAGVVAAIDVGELHDGPRKLGLGSSAAALVAALALEAHARHEDVTEPLVRERLFVRARDVHAQVQGGGSGVDVAASTWGGVLKYVRGVTPTRMQLPEGVHLAAFFSGESARTSSLVARVRDLEARDPKHHASVLAALSGAATAAAEAPSGERFLAAVRAHLPALVALGAAADAPIVPDSFARLGELAADEDAAFLPSGAGGGDVGVFVGMRPPSGSFLQAASHASMRLLPVGIDLQGVRIEPEP